MASRLDVNLWFKCPSCNSSLSLEEGAFANFFEGIPGGCAKCSSTVDLWAALIGAVRENFMLVGAYVLIGAKMTLSSFMLRKHETKEIVFKDCGVPEDAVVLSISYTPNSDPGCFPIELHGNAPRREPPKNSVIVFGASGPSSDQKETPICAAITWVRPPDEDDGWLHLLDAFNAYAAKNWSGIVIPANIASEAAISKSAFDAISKLNFTNKKTIEVFLADAATYAHQVNVLLPLIAELYSVPRLSNQVRGMLNRLRKLRNQLAHEGKLESPLNQNGAAELLVAATFGFHYGRFFRRRIS